MNKNIYLILGAVGILILGGIFFLSQNTSPPVPEPSSTEESLGVQSTTEDSDETEIEVNSEDSTSGDLDNSGLSTRYIDYSEENLEKATEDGGRAVVFFHASWCPMCKAAEADFKANFDKVPSDVTILKADYDTATELKQKYGITMQDTFVQVDSTGSEITKWNSGGEGIETLLANVQ